MKKAVLQRLFSRNNVYVIYGPPLTYKTTIAVRILRLYTGNKIYIGLGKHAYLRPFLKNVHFIPVRSMKEELELILRLPFLGEADNSFIVYDGFGANLLPLRAFYPESVIMRLAAFILAYLDYVSTTHSARVVIVVEGDNFPLFKRVLQEYCGLFIRALVSSEKLVLHVLDKKFSPMASLSLSLGEILEERSERENY